MSLEFYLNIPLENFSLYRLSASRVTTKSDDVAIRNLWHPVSQSEAKRFHLNCAAPPL